MEYPSSSPGGVSSLIAEKLNDIDGFSSSKVVPIFLLGMCTISELTNVRGTTFTSTVHFALLYRFRLSGVKMIFSCSDPACNSVLAVKECPYIF